MEVSAGLKNFISGGGLYTFYFSQNHNKVLFLRIVINPYMSRDIPLIKVI